MKIKEVTPSEKEKQEALQALDEELARTVKAATYAARGQRMIMDSLFN